MFVSWTTAGIRGKKKPRTATLTRFLLTNKANSFLGIPGKDGDTVIGNETPGSLQQTSYQ